MAVRTKTIQIPAGRIGVLMGGPSTERDISLKSGTAVYTHLQKHGVTVSAIDITTECEQDIVRLIRSYHIRCAFVALHGRFGEDGQIQRILEALGIPYTGSGVLASHLAMDKLISRKILQIYGVPVPRYKVYYRHLRDSASTRALSSVFPVVVKPSSHGSSIGLSIVDDRKTLEAALEHAFRYDACVLVEEFVPGRELTVGILDDKVLPAVEIIPKNRYFDFQAKYQVGMTDYRAPAHLSSRLARELGLLALKVHRLIGCMGCSRVDMILRADTQEPCVLEINTIPGLTETSLLPKAAGILGIDFFQLYVTLIKQAYEKKKK